MKLLRAAQAIVTEISAGEIPDWIQLLPGKGRVDTRDGRDGGKPYWNKNPEKIVSAFASFKMPLPGDYEHQSMSASDKIGGVGASGWIEKMEVRGNGEIWGQVKWTAQAADMISKREYRFISPVFDYDRNSREIIQLVSFALTNNPNLYLRAAAAQEGETHMPGLKEKLMKAMNDMAEMADDDEAVKKVIDDCMTAYNKEAHPEPGGDEAPRAAPVPPAKQQEEMAAANARQAGSVDLSQYVPQAQYKALEEIVLRHEEEKLASILDAAVADGRIPPAAKAGYAAMAKSVPDEFKKTVAGLPKVFADRALTNRTAAVITPEVAAQTLTDNELAMCTAFGRSPVEYATLKLADEKEKAANRGQTH